MRHQVKKIKFKSGRDATKSILSKLTLNFIRDGQLETTLKKAKILKSLIDRLAFKALDQSEARKVFILKLLNDKKSVARLFKVVGSMTDKVGGFVRLEKTHTRLGDGVLMAKIKWVESKSASS